MKATERQKQQFRLRRQNLIAAGLCVDCQNTAEAGKCRCNGCRIDHNSRQAQRNREAAKVLLNQSAESGKRIERMNQLAEIAERLKRKMA